MVFLLSNKTQDINFFTQTNGVREGRDLGAKSSETMTYKIFSLKSLYKLEEFANFMIYAQFQGL